LDKTISAKYIQQLVICENLCISQVFKGITLTGGVQHCNSKANLGLAQKRSETLGNLAELNYRFQLKKSGQTEARKNLPMKPRGEKCGQEIWVGTKAQAPTSFLRDFYMANEKRPPEAKVGFEG